MVRTTANLVKGIVEVDANTWPDLDPFILAANELVTEFCGSVVTYTSERLELIERWLAAHFYSIADMKPDNEKAGSVSVKYQYRVDLNLAVTVYGQQAMLLDTEGGLAALNLQATTGKKNEAAINWLGKDRDEYLAEA